MLEEVNGTDPAGIELLVFSDRVAPGIFGSFASIGYVYFGIQFILLICCCSWNAKRMYKNNNFESKLFCCEYVIFITLYRNFTAYASNGNISDLKSHFID